MKFEMIIENDRNRMIEWQSKCTIIVIYDLDNIAEGETIIIY